MIPFAASSLQIILVVNPKLINYMVAKLFQKKEIVENKVMDYLPYSAYFTS